jgi:hypothetical protein
MPWTFLVSGAVFVIFDTTSWAFAERARYPQPVGTEAFSDYSRDRVGSEGRASQLRSDSPNAAAGYNACAAVYLGKGAKWLGTGFSSKPTHRYTTE